MSIIDLQEKREEEERVAIKPAESERNESFKKGFSYFWETFKVLIIALAIIIPVRMYVVQPFIVEGDSMAPNFHDGEYLIVDEISYRLNGPARGEVVVFHPPNDPRNYYIKRLIGLPKETVELKDGKIIIYNNEYPNGKRLGEADYLASSGIGEEGSWTLAEGQYYVLGDNRGNSLDSRRFGPITLKEIKGRALLRAYPFNAFTLLKKPIYFFGA